jgi:hypothetical protein
LRFSQIEEWNKNLANNLNDFGIRLELPILPGKKLFGKTNNSKRDI